MGVIYYVACRECEVKRSLDKFGDAVRGAVDGKEASEVAKLIEDPHSYRAALLVTFLAEHMEHSCTLFNEDCEAMDETKEYVSDDRDFWDSD